MAVLISLLRGINVGGHKMLKMDAVRDLYRTLHLGEPRTYLQSGNVLFSTENLDLAELATRIEAAIEARFGFRPAVILRTTAEMRKVIEHNPFSGRTGLSPNKLLVDFLARDPGAQARKAVRQMQTDPEEIQVSARELYIHFPNGMGKSKLSIPRVDKLIGVPGTLRNWNTVLKLLEMAESLEADCSPQ